MMGLRSKMARGRSLESAAVIDNVVLDGGRSGWREKSLENNPALQSPLPLRLVSPLLGSPVGHQSRSV